MKKQTAVEWLIEQLECRLESLPELNLFDQAKAMEKEQIESAYRAGHNDCSRGKFADSEKYYNETYGQ